MINKNDPAVYIKLARTCSYIGDIELGLTVCKRAIERFPDSSDIHVSQAELLVLLYKDNKDIRNLNLALSILNSVIIKNPYSYLANLLAAQICIIIRDYKKAKEYLRNILITSPNDNKVLQIIKRVEQEEMKRKEDATNYQPMEEIISINNEGQLGNNTSINIEMSIANMNIFLKLKGIVAVILVDEYGMLIKAKYLVSNIPDEGLMATIASNIFRATKEFGRINIGKIKYSILDCPPLGLLYFLNLDNAVLVLIAEQSINYKKIEDAIEKFLAKLLV